MDAVVKRMVFCAVSAGVAAGVTNFGLDFAADKVREYKSVGEQEAPFTCKYCGQPSWIDPSDQSPPPDYCHEIDHGTAEDRTGS